MEVIVHSGSGASSGNEVYLGGHSEAWPNDILFTNSSDTPLDFGLTTSNATTARFWLEFDSIGTSATTFYVYYGKSGASYEGDLTEVGAFGDDFNRANGALGGSWEKGTYTTAVVESNRMKWGTPEAGTGDCPPEGVFHPFTFDSNVTQYVQVTAPDLGSGNRTTFLLADEDAGTDHGLWGIGFYNDTGTLRQVTLTTSGWTNVDTYVVGTNYTWEIKYDNSARTASIYIDGAVVASDVAGTTSADWSSYENKIGFTKGTQNNIGYSYWDNVLVRGWVDPEPTWGAWSSEEGEPPTVSTGSATGEGINASTLHGSIDSLGAGGTCTLRGFEWGTSPGSYSSNWTEEGTYGTGAFSYTATDLNSDTVYYYRAFATNSKGTGYGDEEIFATLPSGGESGWLTGYNYRQKFDVSGGSTSQTDYVISLTLNRYSPNSDYQAFLDSLPFTRRAGNWLRPSGISGSYDKDGLEYNFVIDNPYNPDQLLMYYCPGTLESYEYPAVATSVKGSDVWTKWEGNPLFEHGASIRSLSPIVYNGQIWVYYSSGSPTSGTYLAISDDGFHFTEYNNGDTPVFTGGGTPFVTRFEGDSNWYMYYGSSQSSGPRVAVSTDGIHWTDQGRVLSSSGDAHRGYYGEAKTVYKMGDTYVMLYDAFANYPHTSYPPVIMMATSSSPTGSFTPYSGNPILTGTGTEGDWDSLAVTTGALYWNEDTGRWELYYNGTDSSTFRPCAYGVAQTSTIGPSGSTTYLYDHSLNWPNDIRFTKSDGTTLMSYELDSSGNTANVKVEIPSIPTSGMSGYMYYGKSGGTSGSTTITPDVIFSDDFNRADSDSLGGSWIEQGTTCDGDIASNQLRIHSTEESDVPGNHVRYPITFDQDLTFTFEAQGPSLPTSHNSGYGIYLIGEDSTDHGAWGVQFAYNAGTGIYHINIQNNSDCAGWPTEYGPYTPGSWYTFELRYDSSAGTVAFYINGALVTTQVGCSSASWVSYQNSIVFGGSGSPDVDWYLDDLVVEGFADGGPELSFWYEEEAYGSPTVATGTAAGITTTGATLQGTLIDMGAQSTVYVFFEYGTTTSYGASGSPTVDQAITAAGGFSQEITGLEPGTLYHFRAVARYGASSYTYGSDITFFTVSGTIPGAPTGFGASASATEITLSWTPGAGASQTLIRYSTDTYPTSPSSGVQLYLGSGTTVTHTGPAPGTTYYYSAWGESGGLYSENYATTWAALGAPGTLPNPTSFRVGDVKVFRDYLEPGDMLFVMTTSIMLEEIPVMDVREAAILQILDGDTLVAQGNPTQWGYRPASIYQAPGHGLVWGADYTIKLVGRSGKWASTPESTYELASSSWIGSDLTYLEDWIIGAGDSMGTDYGIELVTYVPGKGEVLTVQGGSWFSEAIPGLQGHEDLKDLFSTAVGEITGPEPAEPPVFEPGMEDAWGSEITDQLEELGSFLHLSSEQVGSVIWIVILVLVAGGLGIVIGPEIGLIVALPLAFVGTYLGLLSMAVVIVIGILLVIAALFKYVLRGI